MTRLHSLPLLGAVVVAVAALTGCGGGNGSSSGGSSSAASASSSTGSVIKTITVSESEYKLSPGSVTLSKPGTYEFKAVNKGSITHALEIEGSGVEEKSGDVGPGQSKTFKVTFKGTGSYEMYCPIDGHRGQGMDGKITIGSAAAGSGGTTTTETSTNKSGGGGGYGY
jgi:uncharacterized cupredoxin-like copper-binding protein